MTFREFTIKDLTRILLAAAGKGDGAEFGIDTIDTDFFDLGYESLALLETGGRIEREFEVKLDDSTLFDSATPRALIEAVNAELTLHEDTVRRS